jgi:biotin/methionine sulfoxide reductase
LAGQLGFGESFTEGRSADQWVRFLYERTRAALLADGAVTLPSFDVFWETGHVDLPPSREVIARSFRALRQDPERNPFDTPSGKIEIYSAAIASYAYSDCPAHPTWIEPEEWLGGPLARRFPLALVSNQPATRLHGQYDNGSYSRDSKIAGREPVLIHPQDARARGIADGDVVRLFNDRGACLAGARLTDGVLPGVLVLVTGAWFDPVTPGVSGSLERHGNPNVLTSDRGTSSLSQGPAPGTTLVQLVREEDPQRYPVRAFTPPEIVRPAAPRTRPTTAVETCVPGAGRRTPAPTRADRVPSGREASVCPGPPDTGAGPPGAASGRRT